MFWGDALVGELHTEGPTFGGGIWGRGGPLSSPGTGSGTSAGLGCPEGPIVRRSERFASVKAFALPDGAGPCKHDLNVRKGSKLATSKLFLATLVVAMKTHPLTVLGAWARRESAESCHQCKVLTCQSPISSLRAHLNTRSGANSTYEPA